MVPDRSTPEKLAAKGPQLAPAKRAPATKRLRVLVGTLLILAGPAAAFFIYETWSAASLPPVPMVVVDGDDPEVVEVITKARAAAEESPRSLLAWSDLAMLLDAHAFAQEAAICYAAAAALDDTNPLWPYFQGAVLLKAGPHPEKALPCLERAASLAPKDWPLARLRLADLLLALDRVDDANREYQAVLASDAGNMRAQFGLAQVALARRQDALTLRYLQAVADDPHIRKRACALRAAAYERLGDHKSADDEHRRFAGFPEDQPWPDVVTQVYQLRSGLRGRILRAQALLAQHKIAQATTLMEETVQKYPQSDQSWAGLGMTRESAKDLAGAERAYQKSIELAPDRADYRFTLGEILQAQKLFKDAATAFRKAIELGPADAKTYFQLGACLQFLGDKAGAADAFRAALRLDPEMRAASQSLEMLGKQ